MYTEVIMENFAAIAVTALTGLLALRLVLIPMGLLWKLMLHGSCGVLCLWLLNSVSGFTGILLPVNTFTVLTAGFLGVPGIALTALLEVLA